MFKRRKQRSVHESDFMKPCFLVNSSHLSLLADENILHHIIRATLLDVNSMYHINRQDTSAVGLLAVCLNPQKRVTGAAQTSQPRRKHEKTWNKTACWFVRKILSSYPSWNELSIFRCYVSFREGISPPVRWGLLDFMSVSSPPPPPSSPPPRLPSPCPVAILCVQCGMSDLNCDPVSSVCRAGLQLRSCECSVAYRTPTAILRVQCGVPDPNCDLVCSVLCAGPQLRFCEFSVAYRTSTAIMRVQCGVPDRPCDGKDW